MTGGVSSRGLLLAVPAAVVVFLLLAMAVGGLLVWWLPVLARRGRWPLVLAGSFAAAAGLAVALAEAAITGGCGFAVAPDRELPAAAWCFAESASRVVAHLNDRTPAAATVEKTRGIFVVFTWGRQRLKSPVR